MVIATILTPDIPDPGALCDALSAVAPESPRHLLIDCVFVTSLSANTRQNLCAFAQKMLDGGSKVRLCNLTEFNAFVIHFVALDRYFDIFDTQEEALLA
ncbi:hypothetical protein K8942_05880 [Candidatus Peribacteria bacterium]|nr:MAG: hypothetical protein K8942_05880 [Candidatus Peribacteria bacterium]